MSVTVENMTKACDYCGHTGEVKARASRGIDERLFCHGKGVSCYHDARGRYFETCSCDRQSSRSICERYSGWLITRRNPDCTLHVHPPRS